MKYLLTLAAAAVLVTAAFSFRTSSPEPQASQVSKNAVFSFNSDDGMLSAMLVRDDLAPGGQLGGAQCVYKLFGAFIDPELGMVGTTYRSFGATGGPGAIPPAVLSVELGASTLTLAAKTGDWQLVGSAAEITAVFAPTIPISPK